MSFGKLGPYSRCRNTLSSTTAYITDVRSECRRNKLMRQCIHDCFDVETPRIGAVVLLCRRQELLSCLPVSSRGGPFLQSIATRYELLGMSCNESRTTTSDDY
jgi:hypothetical protein